jgi:hypothetical protein
MVAKLGIFFWHKLFAIYYTLSGGRLVETPLLMQTLCLELSLYFNWSYFTGTKMACKDDCWEGDYEEAKEQCGASWIDAVCERKHRTFASSGRGSPLRQLARWSHDLTLVHQQKKDGRCC